MNNESRADACYGDNQVEDCVDRVIEMTKDDEIRELAKLYRWHRRKEFLPMRQEVSLIRESMEQDRVKRQQFEDKVSEALYDEKKGLVNIRDWICRSAVVTGVIIGGALTSIPAIRWLCSILGWACK